jgi:hypothetical protein
MASDPMLPIGTRFRSLSMGHIRFEKTYEVVAANEVRWRIDDLSAGPCMMVLLRQSFPGSFWRREMSKHTPDSLRIGFFDFEDEGVGGRRWLDLTKIHVCKIYGDDSCVEAIYRECLRLNNAPSQAFTANVEAA